MNTRAHRVVGSIKHSSIAEERTVRRSTDAQQLGPHSSNASVEEGEERRTAYIMDKINKAKRTHRSPGMDIEYAPKVISQQHGYIVSKEGQTTVDRALPETSAAPVLPISSPEAPTSLMLLITHCTPAPRHLSDGSKPVVRTNAEQRSHDAVSQDEKIKANEHLPEIGSATEMLPISRSAHQAQTMPHRRLDELKSSVDEALIQHAYDIISLNDDTSSAQRSPEPVALVPPVGLPILPMHATPVRQPPDEPLLPIRIAPE